MRWMTVLALVIGGGFLQTATAGSHQWYVNEVFSNPDGSVQFVELHECCGSANEFAIQDKWVLSDATGMQFDFPANLVPGTTADKYLLLATQAFADLPGAPTPDHIIPENFFSAAGDELTYWLYAPATMTFGAGECPTDGVNSLDRDGVVAANSPTNFAGDTGSVTVVPPPSPEFIRGDANQNGGLEIADAVSILGALFSGDTLLCNLSADVNDDNGNDIADAVALLAFLFSGGTPPATPNPDCGIDPTPGALTCDSYVCP